MQKEQSLADFLGVTDPRPVEDVPQQEPSISEAMEIEDPTEFCKRVVGSREFRQYIMNGVVLGDLPPAIGCRLIDHAWGKPVERVEVKDTTSRLEDMTPEQLEARALRLAEMARSIRLAPLSEEKDDRKIIH